MIDNSTLKDLLSQKRPDREKVLLCLAAAPAGVKPVKDIKDTAVSAGWRQAKKKNLSSVLSRATGLAVRSGEGWELTNPGRDVITAIAGPSFNSPVASISSSLRTHSQRVSCPNTRGFIEEAIFCFERGQYRAAVVLSWVGAVSVLHSHVVTNCLNNFNNEASRRDPRWKAATTTDDIGLIKEDTLLDILQSISVIGKNVKQELKKALTLRNGCGHPNSLKIAENKVASHIEDLILNVFATF